MKQEVPVYDTVEISESGNKSLNFLYNTIPGRILLRLFIKTTVSKTAGLILSSPVSCFFIKGFIKKNNINMEEYKKVKYKSFNDFFIRETAEGSRPFPDKKNDLAAPGDGKLTAYPIAADSVFCVKNSRYTIEDLLQDKELADEFSDGICLIFRLTPDDYHRYVYIDDGEVLQHKKIKGVLHTVQPIAFRLFNVFCQNSREYTVIQTENFGKVVQLELGALFVGRIVNKNSFNVKRGDEKGMFQFGGSTIIMLFQKDTIKIDDTIINNTLSNKETIVKMGNKIGES